MRNTVFLPISLINTAANEGWLRSLGYFVRMKSLYKNNTHYNYSLRSLGERMGCSAACLSHHLKILKSKNLIEHHAKNITFRGIRKLQEQYGWKNIGVRVDHKNQYDILRCQLIRFNLSQQEYKIRRSESQNSSQVIVSNKFQAKTNSTYTGLSTFGLGRILGLSKESGSRIRRKLTKLGLLKCRRMYSLLKSNATLLEFSEMKRLDVIPRYSIYRDGNIILQRRLEIQYIGDKIQKGGTKLL